MQIFTFSNTYPYSSSVVFNWHKNILALKRITPPWDKITILNKEHDSSNFLIDGKMVLKQEILPFISAKWKIKHEKNGYIEGECFQDNLISGPIKKWTHHHNFIKISRNKTIITDKVSFSHWVDLKKLNNFTIESMERSFKYRANILEHDLSNLYNNVNGYYVLVTGATGLVGSALVPLLNSLGYNVISLKFKKNSPNTDFKANLKNDVPRSDKLIEINWNPYSSNILRIPDDISRKIKFVVNLSGENILGIWTKTKKKSIINSRVQTTQNLLKIIESNSINPKCCVHASAVGFYGIDKNEKLDEYNSSGDGFLAKTTAEWEKEQNKFKKLAQRNVNLRIGTVLSCKGGLVKQIEIPFKAGIAGYIGSGENFLNWIHIEDLVRIIEKTFKDKRYEGPINAVSPVPIKSKEFFALLGKKYKSKLFINVPSFIPKVLSKELINEIVLSNQKILPKKLLKNEYNFFASTIEEALENL